MSKASIRKHARDRRHHYRARRTLHRSRHRRQVLSAILSSGPRTADFSVRGLHIKTVDVDGVVNVVAERIEKLDLGLRASSRDFR